MKLQPIPAVPEVKDLFALIDFLRDPAAVAERLGQLEGLREELNKQIELVGKADEIETLRIQAGDDRARAKKALDDVYAKASQIAKDAEAESKTLLAATQDGIRHRQDVLAKRAADLSVRESALGQQDAQIKVREQEAGRKEGEARRLLGEANALRAEYDQKLSKLRAAGVT